MTPKEWDELLAADADRDEVRTKVHEHARMHLNTLIEGEETTTDHVLDTIYPRSVSETSLKASNNRLTIYKILARMTTRELADCCRKGEIAPKRYMGKPYRPWVWFKPAERELCPHCGQPMPVIV